MNHLSQLLQAPNDQHWQAAKGVLHNVNGNKNYGIFCFNMDPILASKPSLMLIGHSMSMIETLLLCIVYSLATILSCGLSRNKSLLFHPAMNLNESEYRALAHASFELI